jgi:circadian clock protein KaiB
MSRAKAKKSSAGQQAKGILTMRLYVSSNAPNSALAIANLSAICAENPRLKFRLEIIDVLEHPRRALADGIVVTPSLAKVSPVPAARVVGNLGDRASVLLALGIKA